MLKPKCYGKMFPSLDSREKTFHQGQTFGIRMESLGVGRTGFEVLVDKHQWDDCIECPAYRTCYDLSMAKFQLASVATNR